MTPESVGWTKSSLVLGKHSGRAAFRSKLKELGYADLGDNELNDVFARFQGPGGSKEDRVRGGHRRSGGRSGGARS